MGSNRTYARNPTASSGAPYRPIPAGTAQQNPSPRRSPNHDGSAELINWVRRRNRPRTGEGFR